MERLRPKRSYAAGFTTPPLPRLRSASATPNSWRGCANDAATSTPFSTRGCANGFAQGKSLLSTSHGYALRRRSGQAQDKLSTSAQCPFP
ncbi:MAG: hypothetical protein V7K54_11775 [Nostoc sp.]